MTAWSRYRANAPMIVALCGFAAHGLHPGWVSADDDGTTIAVWANRPLTLPEHVWRIDIGAPEHGVLDSGYLGDGWARRRGYGITLGRLDDARLLSFGVGGAVGVTDRLELGGLLVPVEARPEGRFGDLSLYGRYMLTSSEHADIGAQALVQLPTASDLGVGIALPMRFRAAGSRFMHSGPMIYFLRFDTGVEAEFFGDDESTLGRWAVDVPLDVNFCLLYLNFGLRTGLLVTDATGDVEVSVPLGFHFEGLLSLFGHHDDVLATGSIEFAYPNFVSTGEDTVSTDDWRFNVGVQLHFFPGKESP